MKATRGAGKGRAMISREQLNELREQLKARRAEILALRRNIDDSWQSLHEPERELEEAAAKQTMSSGLEQLDERNTERIRKIDGALRKMEQGTYGACEGCAEPIALKRLQAAPWAGHCRRCAEQREAFERGSIDTTAVALEKERLTDEEMQEAIADALRRDGRVETEELEITCEDGVVYLEGVLPSEASRDMLLEIVEDVLDFKETVDNITIDRLPWERSGRTPRPKDEKSEAEIMMEGEDEEVDIHTSLSTGEPMTPPDKLTPEKP